MAIADAIGGHCFLLSRVALDARFLTFCWGVDKRMSVSFIDD